VRWCERRKGNKKCFKVAAITVTLGRPTERGLERVHVDARPLAGLEVGAIMRALLLAIAVAAWVFAEAATLAATKRARGGGLGACLGAPVGALVASQRRRATALTITIAAVPITKAAALAAVPITKTATLAAVPITKTATLAAVPITKAAALTRRIVAAVPIAATLAPIVVATATVLFALRRCVAQAAVGILGRRLVCGWRKESQRVINAVHVRCPLIACRKREREPRDSQSPK
jgi:hypothetical protein